MTANEYIVKKIDEVAAIFPFASFKYENHILSNSHFIEVDPVDLYEEDEEFKLWEESVVFKFIELYPDQTISFRTKNALVGIDKVDYEVKGQYAQVLYSFNNSMYNFIPVPNWKIPETNGIILNTGVAISSMRGFQDSLINRVVHFSPDSQIYSNAIIFDNTKLNFMEAVQLGEQDFVNGIEITPVDNYSYAMAA